MKYIIATDFAQGTAYVLPLTCKHDSIVRYAACVIAKKEMRTVVASRVDEHGRLHVITHKFKCPHVMTKFVQWHWVQCESCNALIHVKMDSKDFRGWVGSTGT